MKSRGLGPAQPCSPDICKLPDCRCSGVDIPGNLPREKVPQMVMLSFDDAVNGPVFRFYETLGLLKDGERLKNPNGCPSTATFFVSHEYTEYQLVQELYHNRHEIADHTISHRTPTSWWKSANYSQLTDEIVGQREILRKWGQVEAEDVVDSVPPSYRSVVTPCIRFFTITSFYTTPPCLLRNSWIHRCGRTPWTIDQHRSVLFHRVRPVSDPPKQEVLISRACIELINFYLESGLLHFF